MGVSVLTTAPPTPAVKPFPKLMTREGAIALFITNDQGTLLRRGFGSGWGDIGTSAGTWDARRWEDYNGPVTLKNE